MHIWFRKKKKKKNKAKIANQSDNCTSDIWNLFSTTIRTTADRNRALHWGTTKTKNKHDVPFDFRWLLLADKLINISVWLLFIFLILIWYSTCARAAIIVSTNFLRFDFHLFGICVDITYRPFIVVGNFNYFKSKKFITKNKQLKQ